MKNIYSDLLTKTNTEIKEIRSRAQEKIISAQNYALNQTETDFSLIGWKTWSPKELHFEGQFERLEQSVLDPYLKTISVNDRLGIGVVEESPASYKVTGEHCECSDFAYRGLPCKHMYFLAGVLKGMYNEKIRKSK